MSATNNQTSFAEVHTQRTWDDQAPWLMTIYVTHFSKLSRWLSPVIQARCVVDDFGELVAIEEFL